MKLLLVSDYCTLTGGAELAAYYLRHELRLRGHEVRWFSTSAGFGDFEADDLCFGTTSRWRTLLQTANPFAWWRLRGVLASFDPDVVIVSMFLTQLSPLILPLLRSYPTIYRAHWYRPICPKGTKLLPDGSPCHLPWGSACRREGCLSPWDWVALQCQHWMLLRWRRALDLTIADGRVQAGILEANDWKVNAVIVPATVPSTQVREGPGDCAALVVARLVKEKGVEILLQAFRIVASHLSCVKLRIVGDGPERERLEQLARPLGASVEFLGPVPHRDLGVHLRQARVLVMPSLWHEPFGMIALDAQFAGVPVIVSSSAGAADCVENGISGIHVPPGEIGPLADAMTHLLSDPVLADRMGRAAKQSAEQRFGLDAHTEQILRECEALYDSKSTSHH